MKQQFQVKDIIKSINQWIVKMVSTMMKIDTQSYFIVMIQITKSTNDCIIINRLFNYIG